MKVLLVPLAVLILFILVLNEFASTKASKEPFPLKNVIIEGEHGEYVADALRAEFLRSGAIMREDGATIRGKVEWVTVQGNKIEEIRLNATAINTTDIWISSAVTISEFHLLPELRAQGFGGYTKVAVSEMAEDFKTQIIIQQAIRSHNALGSPAERQ